MIYQHASFVLLSTEILHLSLTSRCSAVTNSMQPAAEAAAMTSPILSEAGSD
jgi:hypothetical protein